MMEVLRSSDTSVLTRATQRNVPEDGIIHSYRRENLKFYLQNLLHANRNEETGFVDFN
jgi:hypothetical protein